jgi:hypothetical protein
MFVTLHCTDKDQNVEAEIVNHRPEVFLEVVINSAIKMSMQYNKANTVYVGSAAGLEFTVKQDQVPAQPTVKEFKRRR